MKDVKTANGELIVDGAANEVLQNLPPKLEGIGGYATVGLEVVVTSEGENRQISPYPSPVWEKVEPAEAAEIVAKPTVTERMEMVLVAFQSKAGDEDHGETVVLVGGRPPVLDDQRRMKCCLLLKVGYSRRMAAVALGVAPSTITRTMKRDAGFRLQVLRAEEQFAESPLLTIVEAAQTDWRAAAWLMKHHQPHESVDRRKRRKKEKRSRKETEDFFAWDLEGNVKRKREERKKAK